MNPSLPPQLALSRRIIAGMGAALVLFLTVAAASPTVHGWLHGQADDHTRACGHQHDHEAPAGAEEAGCAVTLFCHGILPLLGAPLPVPALPAATSAPDHFAESFVAAQPRYRHVPSHAPPSA